jgi:serine/threonine protein kinase/Tfp pilus assembly protein PilF
MNEVTLFHLALQKLPGERAALLDEACQENAELRAEVERLLAEHERHETCILDSPPPGLDATVERPVSEGPGVVIGSYKLLEQIGEGGFGLVFVAEQHQPVRRKVALKVIKPGMDTRQVIARFEAERQALALMDHPNIAKVYDAGTTEAGRPYFVMELVRGIPITEYCDLQQLTPRERLALFVTLCHAIQHAHQKGVIHRDVKPTNVLVTEHDGRPIVKVIDFGVAKALSQQLTDRTIYTQFAQMIGTPLYMSPEQAAMSGLDIDTRSDIYSLGVLLYELLTGSTPFDSQRLQQAAVDEIRRIIRDEEPPKPSTRLSQSGDRLPTIAARRSTESAGLSKLVRGDLDWIVMKCLEKDRARRYETANGLAMDIQRHLDNEPIEARPATSLYRFQKLVRRNKLAAAAASAVMAALILGLSVSTWMFVKERKARQRAVVAEQQATSEAAKSRQVSDFMKAMLQGVGPSVALGRDTRMLREIVDQTAERLDQDLKDQPTVEADLRATLGNVYYDLGEYPRAEVMHRRAMSLRRTLLGDKHPDVADSLNDLGQVLYGQGKFADAEAAHREALTVRRELFGDEHLDVAQSLNNLAESLRRQGSSKFPEAETLFRAALAMRRKLLVHDHADVAKSLNDLGLLLTIQGIEGQNTFVEAVRAQREALTIRRKLFGNGYPDVATSLDRLALALTHQGKPAEAEPIHHEALAMRRKLFGDEHPDLAHSLHNLAHSVQLQGMDRSAEAERLLRDALAMRRKLLGDAHGDTVQSILQLAMLLERQDKYAESESLYHEALAIAKVLPSDFGISFASLFRKQGKWDEAETILQQTLRDLRSRLPANNAQIGNALAELTRTLLAADKFVEAEVVALECLDLREEYFPNVWSTFNARHNLGGSLLGQKRYAEAEPLLLAGYWGMKQRELAIPAIGKPRLKDVLERLVQLYEETDQPDKVAQWKARLAEFQQMETEKQVDTSAPKKHS